MTALLTNAPIQNRDFNPDISSGSVLPIVVADYQIAQAEDGQPRVDLWNNVLAVEQQGHDTASFQDRSEQRLGRKYQSRLLASLPEPDKIFADDKSEFKAWGQAVVRRVLDNGTLSVEKREVHTCDICDGTIAHAEVELRNGCVSCASSETHIEEKSVLLAKLGSAAWGVAAVITGDASLRKLGADEMEIIINKKRLSGVCLDEFGFEDDVIDPKIGIGLLALYAAEYYGFSAVSIVVGRSSSRKNVPQLAAFLGQSITQFPSLRTSEIARAPLGYLSYLRDDGVIDEERYIDIICRVLPPYLLKMKKDMCPATLDRIIFSNRSGH